MNRMFRKAGLAALIGLCIGCGASCGRGPSSAEANGGASTTPTVRWSEMGVTLNVPSDLVLTRKATRGAVWGPKQQNQEWMLAKFSEPLADTADWYSESLLVGQTIGSEALTPGILQSAIESDRSYAQSAARQQGLKIELRDPDIVSLGVRKFYVSEYELTTDLGPYVVRTYFAKFTHGIVWFTIYACPQDLERFKAICEPIIAQAQIN